MKKLSLPEASEKDLRGVPDTLSVAVSDVQWQDGIQAERERKIQKLLP